MYIIILSVPMVKLIWITISNYHYHFSYIINFYIKCIHMDTHVLIHPSMFIPTSPFIVICYIGWRDRYTEGMIQCLYKKRWTTRRKHLQWLSRIVESHTRNTDRKRKNVSGSHSMLLLWTFLIECLQTYCRDTSVHILRKIFKIKNI